MCSHPAQLDVAAGHVGRVGAAPVRVRGPVRIQAVVVLVPSAAERLLTVLRWLLGLGAAVVVLWFGSAFLASPASAAEAPANHRSSSQKLSLIHI